MSTPNEIPTSGFHLLRVVTIYQEYQLSDEDSAPEGEGRKFVVNWDWRVAEDRQFDVFLSADLGGNKEAPETVSIGIVGEFLVQGSVPSMNFRNFVQTAAPAILFPYLRQIISELTGRGPHGPYYLPSVNVVRMMKEYDFEATSGAKQLREDRELAEQYGWPTDVQLSLPSDQAAG